MIRFINVSKRYPTGHEALSQVNFHLESGEMVFLTGHSGAGKSTLLKLIALFERTSQGQVLVNGMNLNAVRQRKVANLRQTMGIILQNPHLLHQRTVFDNVA